MAQALASATDVEDRKRGAAAAPIPPEEIAERFPQFEVTECLGRGGMGVVYKARQKSLDRWVAIKILPPERVGEKAFADRFAREAAVLAKLSHPNIVTVHDFGEADGLFYIVMEYVDGVNLRDLLREGKLEPEQAVTIVPPICDALCYAHEHGIVHRDIKPENILLDKNGRVKVADFGIAKILAANGSETPDGIPAPENATRSVVGTPAYSAPEQKSEPQRVDNRADIYSLGVVFYEMLTGELPGKSLEPPSRKVQIDVRLDEIVLRALERKPELRYQQASVLKTQVETIAVGLGASPAEAEPRRKVVESPTSDPLGYVAFFFAVMSGVIPTIFYWLKPWAAPWLSPEGQQFMLWLTLFAAIVAIALGVIARKTRFGWMAAVYGSVTLAIWLLFFVAGRISGTDDSLGTPGLLQDETLEIQPDGGIAYQLQSSSINRTGVGVANDLFWVSNFVHVQKVTDDLGRPLQFEVVTKRGDLLHYHVWLDALVPPMGNLSYASEGTMVGLIHAHGEPGVFEYAMDHSPGYDGITHRIERHMLPAGAQVVWKNTADLKEEKVGDHVELHIDRRIPRGGHIEVRYRYQLSPTPNQP